ncbi:unnamed protein product [Closterium sp. NIES-54]
MPAPMQPHPTHLPLHLSLAASPFPCCLTFPLLPHLSLAGNKNENKQYSDHNIAGISASQLELRTENERVDRQETEPEPRLKVLPARVSPALCACPAPRCCPACTAALPCPRAYALHRTFATDPSFESAAASALVAELVDFAAACRLDYATCLVAESESDCPPSVGGECALGTDVLEDMQQDFECFAVAVPHLVSMLIAPEGDPDSQDIPTPRSYVEAITGLYSSQWHTAMDAEMASWKSTGTYVDAVPPPGANIVDGMWIFRVKRPPAQHDYELHSLVFSTAFLQGSLHEEIWSRRPPGFTGSFPAGTQWSLWRPVYGLRQAPREWHDTLRTTLEALGFAPLTADPSLFLRTDTSLPPFYVLVYNDDLVFATADTEALALVKSELQKRHTCTDLAPPSDESVESSGPYPELVGCLMALRYLCSTLGMGLVLGGRGPVGLTGHADASWVDDLAMQRSSHGYTFSLGSGSVSWRSTHLSSVLSSSCEAEIYARAIAAQELRWLTYLLTDLGEWPRSSPVLYVDNKAMISLCQEHKVEHRTKHIALRYFLARKLQQRGQLRLACVATWANTADIFTKALQSVSRCWDVLIFDATVDCRRDVQLLMGGGADEGLAIGAGAAVFVVASAFADVAATAVVCYITANALVRSASGKVYEC